MGDRAEGRLRVEFQRNPIDPCHGTEHGYREMNCRCDPCKTWYRRTETIRVQEDPTHPSHGSQNGYTYWQCRCDPCTEAHAMKVQEGRDRSPATRDADRITAADHITGDAIQDVRHLRHEGEDNYGGADTPDFLFATRTVIIEERPKSKPSGMQFVRLPFDADAARARAYGAL